MLLVTTASYYFSCALAMLLAKVGLSSSSSSFYLNQVTRPINTNKRHTDRQIDSISKRKKKSDTRCTIKHSKTHKNAEDTHIEVISPYHCYDCSRHTGMNFYNYESPCQMMVNPMLATSLLVLFSGVCSHTSTSIHEKN